MSAAKYDIILMDGSTYNKKLVWTDSSNNPINLTNHFVRMGFVTKLNDSTPLVFLNSDRATANGSIINLNELLGEVVVNVAKGDVTSFNVDRGYYDIEVVPPLKESVYDGGSYTDITISPVGGAGSFMRLEANDPAAAYNTKFVVDELIVLRGSSNSADDGVYKIASINADTIDCTVAGPSGVGAYTTNPNAKIFSFDENKVIRILQGRVTRSGSASPYRSVDFTS